MATGPDIFGTAPTYGGGFSMDEATVTFPLADGDGGLGLLVQSVSSSYQRPINRIFELSKQKTTYYVAGRQQGTIGIQRLAAPRAVSQSFLEKFADICQVQNNTFSISADPGISNCSASGNPLAADAQGQRYTFSYAIITQLGFNISVNAFALSESLSMMFVGLRSG